MVAYLYQLTFRHAGPMASEYYLRDLPIVYHFREFQLPSKYES